VKGTKIIVTAEPKGTFLEGIITDTSKPGTLMEKVPATAPVDGRFSYRHASRTAGSKGPICVLLEDGDQGQIYSTAYVANKRCFLYFPVAGEDLNLLVLDIAGTADDVAIGDLFGVEATGGKLHANSSYASAPFEANEVVTDPVADYWLWVTYLGNLA